VTIAQWLSTREPAPPAALAERVREALSFAVAERGELAGALDHPASALPEVALRAAEVLLRPMLTRGCVAREQALDLLAVDALVTYAIEAASEDAERLEVCVEGAMARLAAISSGLGA
jgi:uncharacterized membrane protein